MWSLLKPGTHTARAFRVSLPHPGENGAPGDVMGQRTYLWKTKKNAVQKRRQKEETLENVILWNSRVDLLQTQLFQHKKFQWEGCQPCFGLQEILQQFCKRLRSTLSRRACVFSKYLKGKAAATYLNHISSSQHPWWRARILLQDVTCNYTQVAAPEKFLKTCREVLQNKFSVANLGSWSQENEPIHFVCQNHAQWRGFPINLVHCYWVSQCQKVLPTLSTHWDPNTATNLLQSLFALSLLGKWE